MNELLGPIYYVFANAARTNACDYCCCVHESTDPCTPYFHRAQLYICVDGYSYIRVQLYCALLPGVIQFLLPGE